MKKDNDKLPGFVKRNGIVSGTEYSQLLKKLKDRFRKSQIKAAVKVNTAMLEYYWEMGRDISRLHRTAKWGSSFFDCLSLDLKAEFPGRTGFSVTNIKYAKRWYEFYNQANNSRQRPVDEITPTTDDGVEMPHDFGTVPWGQHIDIFTKSKSTEEALFYIEETIRNSWSRPELNAA